MCDKRERGFYPAGIIADHERQILVDEYEGTEHKAAYTVCPVCDGKGSHVDPAIDGNGLSAEDFADDPDFREAYFGGSYDVQCSGCRGMRVVLEPTTAEGKAVLRERAEAAMAYDAERMAEIRMGA